MSTPQGDVTIRAARPEDAADIRAIYAPFVQETSVSFETVPPSLETMAERIAGNLASHGYFVAQSDAGILGFAYASPYRPRPAYDRTAEVSVYLAPEGQGRGLARALYRMLFAHLAVRGFHTAVAIVTLPNLQSAQLHERCGFAHVGSLQDVGCKFGQWHGTAIYQRMIGQADLQNALRRLEASDTAALAQVLTLIQTSFAYMTGRIDPPSSMHQLTVSKLAQMAKDSWLLALGDPVTACLVAKPLPHALYLGKIAIVSDLRGRGVLRALMGASETLAHSMSLSRLEIQVRIELVENQRIFGKYGFVETARNAHPGYDRATEITMQKVLKP
ncbi:GNAT family N-acetyltransferase [Planktomarina sp.]|uniref:GNAT family N-acetyltransferase n=1 Tax=Planktomarina sp. TaxID=2024851 RepID=UPI00288ED373|nr:GNAT family N-acetyltransferase [Planktomarina sp.]